MTKTSGPNEFRSVPGPLESDSRTDHGFGIDENAFDLTDMDTCCTHETGDSFSFSGVKVSSEYVDAGLFAHRFAAAAARAGKKKHLSKPKKPPAESEQKPEIEIKKENSIDVLLELFKAGSGEDGVAIVKRIYELGREEPVYNVQKSVSALEEIALSAIKTKDKALIAHLVTDQGMIIDKLFDLFTLGNSWNMDMCLKALRKIHLHLFIDEPLADSKTLVGKLYDVAEGYGSLERETALALLRLTGRLLARQGDTAVFGPFIDLLHSDKAECKQAAVSGLMEMCSMMLAVLESKGKKNKKLKQRVKAALPVLTSEILPKLMSRLDSSNNDMSETAANILIAMGKLFSAADDCSVVNAMGDIILDESMGYSLQTKKAAAAILGEMQTKHAKARLIKLFVEFKAEGSGWTEMSRSMLAALLTYLHSHEEQVRGVIAYAYDADKIMLWKKEYALMVDAYSSLKESGGQYKEKPHIEGGKYVFPAGTIPSEAVTVSVQGQQKAWPKHLGREVTFILDYSGSMDEEVKEGKHVGQKKVDVVKGAFSNLLASNKLPSNDEVTYKLNAFGPDGSEVTWEVSGVKGDKKDTLKDEIKKLDVGGASYIWANLEGAIEEAKPGGTIILYTDGKSDTDAFKLNGDPEYEDDDPAFEDLKQRLAKAIGPEGKDLNVHIICGTDKAADHIETFAAKSENIASYNAYEQDLEAILDDIVTSKTAVATVPHFKAKFLDKNSEIVGQHGDGTSIIPQSVGIIEVKSGIAYDDGSGEITLGDIVLDGDLDGKKVILSGEYSLSGKAEFVYADVAQDLPPPVSAPPVVMFLLDVSSSMGDKVKVDGKKSSKLDVMRDASYELAMELMDHGAMIGINAFSTLESDIELMPTDKKKKVSETFSNIEVHEKGTALTGHLQNMVLSMPPGASIILPSDGQSGLGETYFKLIESLAKAKDISIYYLYAPVDCSGNWVIVSEASGVFKSNDPDKKAKVCYKWKKSEEYLQKLSESTGGMAVEYSGFEKLEEAYGSVGKHMKSEHSKIEVVLPKPKVVKIPIKTSEGKSLILKADL